MSSLRPRSVAALAVITLVLMYLSVTTTPAAAKDGAAAIGSGAGAIGSGAGAAGSGAAAVRKALNGGVRPAVAVPCSATFRCSRPISGQYQQRSNWCGPAAAATVLTNWAISGVAQSWLADFMNTDTLGFTPPWNIDDALNNRINAAYGAGLNPYSYYSTVTNAQLWSVVRHSVYYFDEVYIITVYSHKIWYPEAGTGIAHYLVIYGYSDAAGGYMVWDPSPSSRGGAHHLSKNDWERVAYPGRFVIGPNYTV
jgi:hypothetical protein